MKKTNKGQWVIEKTRKNLTLSMNRRLYSCIKERAIKEIENNKTLLKECSKESA